jgi:hypothetical protein
VAGRRSSNFSVARAWSKVRLGRRRYSRASGPRSCAGVGTPSGSGRGAPMRFGQVQDGTAFTSTYAPGASPRLVRWAQVPYQSAVLGVSQLALRAAADGLGWLLDNRQRSGGWSLLLLAAAPVVQDQRRRRSRNGFSIRSGRMGTLDQWRAVGVRSSVDGAVQCPPWYAWRR